MDKCYIAITVSLEEGFAFFKQEKLNTQGKIFVKNESLSKKLFYSHRSASDTGTFTIVYHVDSKDLIEHSDGALPYKTYTLKRDLTKSDYIRDTGERFMLFQDN